MFYFNYKAEKYICCIIIFNRPITSCIFLVASQLVFTFSFYWMFRPIVCYFCAFIAQGHGVSKKNVIILVLLGGKGQVWRHLRHSAAKETRFHFQVHQLQPLLCWYIFLNKSNRALLHSCVQLSSVENAEWITWCFKFQFFGKIG